MPQRNSLVQENHDRVSQTNVDTDGSGDVTITVSGLRQIESPADVHAQATGGYVANVQSVSDNSVTVRIFQSAGSAAEMAAVTSGTDVTDVYVEAVGQ